MTEVRFYWQSFSGSPAILERRSVASGSSKEMDPRDEERVHPATRRTRTSWALPGDPNAPKRREMTFMTAFGTYPSGGSARQAMLTYRTAAAAGESEHVREAA